jgi:DNA-binding CsgD family transcriptional regulator
MSSFSDDLFTFLASARAVSSMPELDNAFATLINRWGFDRWTAMPIGSPSMSPVRPFEIIFGRPSREWSVRYREQNYSRHDAALRTLLHSNDAIWWSTFARGSKLSTEERRLFDESREFGVGEGLSAPVRIADQSVWVCALTGTQPERHWEIADAARFAAERYVLKALELREPDVDASPHAPITPAQIEIVRLLARGQNLKQAAHTLKLSPSTVYNQIASAKHRMSVKTVPELLRRITESGGL